MQVRELMQQAPVIPVLVVDDVKYAVPLAEALVAGGLPVLEVTMRTAAALDVVRAMTSVTGAIVGVGTALDGDDLRRAQDHGASFAVSPGYTQALGTAARQLDLPLLPGVMTPADIMRARDGGYTELKFFPAEQAGGTRFVESICRALYGDRVLPNRRHQRIKRQRVSTLGQCLMRWWILGSAKNRHAAGRLGLPLPGSLVNARSCNCRQSPAGSMLQHTMDRILTAVAV